MVTSVRIQRMIKASDTVGNIPESVSEFSQRTCPCIYSTDLRGNVEESKEEKEDTGYRHTDMYNIATRSSRGLRLCFFFCIYTNTELVLGLGCVLTSCQQGLKEY